MGLETRWDRVGQKRQNSEKKEEDIRAVGRAGMGYDASLLNKGLGGGKKSVKKCLWLLGLRIGFDPK